MDLPLAERPVNQIVHPFWPRKALRSACVRDGCHVMLLFGEWVSVFDGGRERGLGGAHLRCCHSVAMRVGGFLVGFFSITKLFTGQ